MGHDPNETIGRPRPAGKSPAVNSSKGCFISINPDKGQKERARVLEKDEAALTEALHVVLDHSIRVSLKYDQKNDAYVATATRLGDTFEDAQTVAAYHGSATRALCLLLVVMDRAFLGVPDWRVQQLRLDLDW